MTHSGAIISCDTSVWDAIGGAESNCPVCGQEVCNHDDYVLLIRCPDGDMVTYKPVVAHTNCLSLPKTVKDATPSERPSEEIYMKEQNAETCRVCGSKMMKCNICHERLNEAQAGKHYHDATGRLVEIKV